MQRQRKKLKVYREEVKERFTTHWDLDYMTTAELEAAMAAGRDWENPKPAAAPSATGGISGLIKRIYSIQLGKHA